MCVNDDCKEEELINAKDSAVEDEEDSDEKMQESHSTAETEYMPRRKRLAQARKRKSTKNLPDTIKSYKLWKRAKNRKPQHIKGEDNSRLDPFLGVRE